jgi:alpha-tubulin suppressor-like RCC1 family protein
MNRHSVAALGLIGASLAVSGELPASSTFSRAEVASVRSYGKGMRDRSRAAVPGVARMTAAQTRKAVRVAAGSGYTCAVTRRGRVECWGAIGSIYPASDVPPRSSVPVPVRRLRSASSVTTGQQHSCALLRNGGIDCWGTNGLGQLGDGSTKDRSLPAPVRGLSGRAVAVSAGLEHTCAVLKAGDVECWGANSFGQLGDGSSRDRSRPVSVRGLRSAARAVSAGGRHTCALMRSGGVECWGADYSGQLGDGEIQERAGSVRVRGLAGAVGVAAGRAYTCAVIRDGTVKCWGANAYGQLGDGTLVARRLPKRVRGLAHRAVAVSAGERHTCALLRGGAVACWGANGIGQLGNGSELPSRVALRVRGLGAAVMVSTGDLHTCAVTKAGRVRCWGMNTSGELGAGTMFERSTPLRVAAVSGAEEVAAGGGHTCARTSTAVACWGANEAGQLGNRKRLDSSTPVPLSGLSAPVLSLAAGDRHTCALTASGKVECWGANGRGQLGDGTLLDRGRAVAVRALPADSVRITAGESHTCALSAQGEVRCWGENASGQLGRRTLVARPYAAPVRRLQNAAEISAGGRHTCAVTTEGQVECWGANDWGQLGSGSQRARAEPARVTGLAGEAVDVTSGDNHACALMSTGEIACWGANDRGQLGIAARTASSKPARVPGLAGGAASVTSGDNHTCALMRTGRIRCWGANDSGQLGAGTFRPRLQPVTVVGPKNAAAVSAGGDHTCLRTDSGSLACWGWNHWGQLGDAAPRAAGSPTPVDAIGFG